MCYLILVYNGWLITINKFSNLLRCTYMVNVFLQIHLWARVAQRVRSLDLTTHTSLSPIRRGFVPSFVNYKKGCTRLAAASDKVYQLLAHGSLRLPPPLKLVAMISLKVALKHQKSNQSGSSIRGVNKLNLLYELIVTFVS